jgi:hypothetical protein
MGAGIVQDDAFYYLVIARNFLAGLGVTFDGINPTNGFHPLHLLTLLPLLGLTDSPEAGLRLAVLSTACWGAAAGLLVHRLGLAAGGRRTGLAALALWAIHPLFLAGSLNGQETSLATLLLLAFLGSGLALLRPGARPSRRGIPMGIWGGLGFLARSDFLLAAAAMVPALLAAPSPVPLRRRLAALGWALATALTLWLPWGAWSRSAVGSWLPQSGPASRLVATSLGWFELDHVWSDPAAGEVADPLRPPPTYTADVLTKGVLTFLGEHPLLSLLRPGTVYTPWPDAGRLPLSRGLTRWPAAGAALLILLGTAGAAVWIIRCRQGRAEEGPFLCLAGTTLLLVPATLVVYASYSPSHWYFPRYLTPSLLISSLAILAAAERWATAPGSGPTRRVLFLGVILLALPGIWQGRSLLHLSWRPVPPSGFLARWQRVAPLLPPGERLGSFQAGTYAWFGRREVVNLDGKVNPGALRALREGRLDRYLARERIAWILDWPLLMDRLLLRNSPEPPWELVLVDPGRGPLEVALYRVMPAAAPPPRRGDRALPPGGAPPAARNPAGD